MSAYLSFMGGGVGGRLFEAGRLLTFSAFRKGAYSNKYGITADPRKAVYIGSEPATPSKHNRKLSLHYHL